jgi:hypothetical protein
MKFKLVFVATDDLEDLRVAANDSLKKSGLEEDEIDAVFDIRLAKFHDFVEHWLTTDGKVTLEFDTDKDTCLAVEIEEC